MTPIKSIRLLAAYLTCALLIILLTSAASFAGTIELYLVIDPATTAGAGVPPAGGFGVTSTRSGAGTWQLYVVDEAQGSFGIAQVQAKLNGIIPAINNRLTQTIYDTADDTGFKAGFTLLRSATNVNPVFGSAELPGSQPFTQGGLGITAGNYSNIPGAAAFSGTTNGQWGNYGLGPNTTSGFTVSGNMRNALFVAEGTYTGAAPSIDLANSFVVYYTNAALNLSTQANASTANRLVGVNPIFLPFIGPEPATMTLLGLAVVGFAGLVGRRRF